MTIAEIRRSRGFTQEDLAALLGCSVRTVQRWEAGTVDVPVGQIRELAERLGAARETLAPALLGRALTLYDYQRLSGRTIAEVAGSMGLSSSQVQRLHRGECGWSEQRLRELAELYGISYEAAAAAAVSAVPVERLPLTAWVGRDSLAALISASASYGGLKGLLERIFEAYLFRANRGRAGSEAP